MALYTFNGTLISGLTADKNCCCSAYNCYCYTRYTNYGSTLVERKRVCYKVPFYNGSAWVFPDGQPCVPVNPGFCSISYSGIVVTLCSCPGGGANPYRWDIVGSSAQWAACTTISPPP